MRRTLAWSLMLLAAACSRPKPEPPPQPVAPPPIDVQQVEPATVTLWFPTAELEYLESEVRDVVSQDGSIARLAESVADAVLAGPEEEGHVSALPEGLRAKKVEVADGTATVDLPAEFESEFEGGSNVASMAIYSLVNSLCELEGVDRVRLMIGGKPGGEFAGVLDLSQPLEPDTSLEGAAALEDAPVVPESEAEHEHLETP